MSSKKKVCTKNTRLCGDIDCIICIYKTFCCSDRVEFWDYDRNILYPWQVALNSHDKFFFMCPNEKCNHPFEISPHSIIQSDSWCGYCDGKRLCREEDNCRACIAKSCAGHERMLKEWDPENDLPACEVSANAHNPMKFICSNKKCKHPYQARPHHININNSKCPFCTHQKLCTADKNCAICRVKSCAANPIMDKYWDPSNDKESCEVFRSSGKPRKFICNICPEKANIFAQSPAKVTGNNSWCPNCRHKTEAKLKAFLLEEGHKLGKGCKDWCKNPDNNRHMPFDIVIDKLMNIVECDGEHHFSQISNWNSPEENMQRDAYKMHHAAENDYTVIRIYQPDILFDRNNWQKKLLSAIKKYESPKQIYIASDLSIYNPLKKLLE